MSQIRQIRSIFWGKNFSWQICSVQNIWHYETLVSMHLILCWTFCSSLKYQASIIAPSFNVRVCLAHCAIWDFFWTFCSTTKYPSLHSGWIQGAVSKGAYYSTFSCQLVYIMSMYYNRVFFIRSEQYAADYGGEVTESITPPSIETGLPVHSVHCKWAVCSV